MDPVLLLRGFFLGAASTVLLVHSIPILGSRFLAYGPRTEARSGTETAASVQRPYSTASMQKLWGWLDYGASLRVPHSWFTHFYILSIFCSVFWATQVLSDGSAFHTIASSLPNDTLKSMSVEQVILTWILMLVQGIRRLYESLTLTKPSKSRMWILHWLLGLAFYLNMSAAVWVEGIPALSNAKPSFHHLVITAPSLKTFISIPIFLIASGIQYDCHAYLASLKKYTLPMHPMFQSLVCPHYFAECLIYLSLALIAAPPGQLLNKTILCALLFVSVNLGVTAAITKEWYAQKFGMEKVKGRWCMIPFVF